MRLAIVILILIALGLPSDVMAQESQQTPKTKVEAFTGVIGAVLIKGYSEIGSIKGQGDIAVTAMMFKNAKTNQEEKGILFEVGQYGSRKGQESKSYLDYDELDGLISGISYISQADDKWTAYPFYEAIYSTRGNLKLTVFNSSSGTKSAAVQAGSVAASSAFISIEQLAALKDMIVKAKQVLDNPGAAKALNDRPPVAVTNTRPAVVQPSLNSPPQAAPRPARPPPKPAAAPATEP